jgi:hypothetical protein
MLEMQKESGSLLVNMFSSFKIISYGFAIHMFFTFLCPCCCFIPMMRLGKLKGLVKSLHGFFNLTFYVVFFLEASFFMMYIALKEIVDNLSPWVSMTFAIIGIGVLSFLTLLVPIHYYCYRKKEEDLLEGKFSAMYEGLKISKTINAFYFFFFMLRRVLMILVMVFGSHLGHVWKMLVFCGS